MGDEISQKEEKLVLRKPKKLPKAITSEEFTLLISKIPDNKKYKKMKIAFLLAYESGLRVSEIAALNKENFRNDGSINIIDSKGGKDRVVPIPKSWNARMMDYLPIRKSSEMSCIRCMQRFFSKFAKSANLNPEYTFHSLRHGFATRLIEKGVPLNQIQLFMGHEDLQTTSIYTKARPIDALKSYLEKF